MFDHEKSDSTSSSIEPLSTISCTTTPSNSIAETREESNCWAHKAPVDEERPGLRGYLAVFGAFVSLLVTFGQMNAFGTFQTWYSNHQLHRMSQSTISWIGSLQLLIFFLTGAPVGRCFDAFGPTVLLTIGSVLFTLSLVLTSISTMYWHYILAQGLLFGFGVAFMFYPVLASVTTHFSKYRATALGIAAAGSSVGGVVYPIMLQHLFERIGFAWGVRASALVSGVGCLLATLTVSNNRKMVKNSNNLPCEQARKSAPYVDLTAFKDPRFSLLALGSSFVALGLYIPFFYVVEFAEQLNISPRLAFYVLSAMNAGGIFGRIAPAYISDTIGHFNLLTPAAFLSGLATLALWYNVRNLAGLMVFATIYGFLSGAFISVLTPSIARISERGQVGTRMGMLYSVISVPSLLGNPAAGALLTHSRSHSFHGMIVFSGCTVIFGSFGIWGARLSIERKLFAQV
ncbi:Riboflavin transporter MCH5 [Leucoagaricus sp. SymC.cos]|nr:Riboflavin transporter MCH5 [Leucoagaricus sp. SymC.cos]